MDGLVKKEQKYYGLIFKQSQMNLITKLIFIFLLSTLCFLLSPTAKAAKLYFQPAAVDLEPGRLAEAELMLDAQNEAINAVEAELLFDADFLELVSVREGGSIVSLWLNKPAVSCQDNLCRLSFSGVVPGGFQGVLKPYDHNYYPGQIFKIFFKVKSDSSGQLDWPTGRVLLNDGLGTEAQLSLTPLAINFGGTVQPNEALLIKDTAGPGPFVPAVSQEPSIFSGKYFLAFLATDKGEGLDHYEVAETRSKAVPEKNWNYAESPYLLVDQSLSRYIFVKAVDKAGNFRIAVVEPAKPYRWYQDYLVYVIILIILAMVVLRFRKNKARK